LPDAPARRSPQLAPPRAEDRGQRQDQADGARRSGSSTVVGGDSEILKPNRVEVMKLARFRTNLSLWIFFSFIFFISAWFVPLIECKGGAQSIFVSIWESLRAHAPGNAREVLRFLDLFALVAIVPATVLGWLAQSLFMMFSARNEPG